MKFISLLIAMFTFSITLQSQPIDITVFNSEIAVVNKIKKEFWYTGYSYKVTGDCETWQSPIFLPQDTVYLDPPSEFFTNAFTVNLVIHTPWNTITGTCVRTWYPQTIVYDTVQVSTDNVTINCNTPQFNWFDVKVLGSHIELVPNNLILPATVIKSRIISNSMGHLLYVTNNNQSVFTLSSGTYFCLTILEGQGGIFLAGNTIFIP